MTFSSRLFKKRCKISATYVLSACLLVACQPPPATDDTALNSNDQAAPVIIEADSVLMSPEHILNIKSSRYQPSLGLQSTLEPAEEQKLIAAKDLIIDKILVAEGDWVEKGSPLFVVYRQATNTNSEAKKANTLSDQTLSDSSATKALKDNVSKGNEPEDSKSEDKALIEQATSNISNKNNKESGDIASNLQDTKSQAKAVDTNTNNLPKTATLTSNKNKSASTPVTVIAKTSGYVSALFIEAGQTVKTGKLLLELGEKSNLHFVATLPIQAKPQLSVGQTVNFSAEALTNTFTGQVSKLTVDNTTKQLLVYVSVIDNEVSRAQLLPGMSATGRVNYGQIEVGTIVPRSALHDVDLSALQKPPYQTAAPLNANIWIIKQDQRLTRQPVEVIEYDPSTEQYLIAGVSNDSLICLADLPVESAGKLVIVS